jgi:acetyl esterase
MGKYNIHRDLQKLENMKFEFKPSLLPIINKFLAISMKMKKPAAGVKVTKKRIPGYQNATIEVTVYEPDSLEKNAPCLIYLHGGAFLLKAATYHKYLICEYALKTPCKVIFVDYRLAPKHGFPVGVEDCYAAFDWVCKNAGALDIDINRIAVGGDSAGGALAAAVTHMARDRKAQGICFQMLIYPVTDARQITDTTKNYTDTPVWNAISNRQMWKLYLRDGDHGLRPYASPMEAASFEDLPDAYVEVSEFDCLRDEGIHYAEALQQSGCHVELNKTAGTVHGFELSGENEITNQYVMRRIEALKKVFNSVDS